MEVLVWPLLTGQRVHEVLFMEVLACNGAGCMEQMIWERTQSRQRQMCMGCASAEWPCTQICVSFVCMWLAQLQRHIRGLVSCL